MHSGGVVCRPPNRQQGLLAKWTLAIVGRAMMNVAVMMPPRSPSMMIAMGFAQALRKLAKSFTFVACCSTLRDPLTGCVPADWSCQCP
jgi:hypothetical protein